MESAALQAYRKDVENNADLSSVVINQKLSEGNFELTAGVSGSISAGKITKLWNEAKRPNGKSYYCNIMTKGIHFLVFFLGVSSVFFLETTDLPPKEGFLSLKEQREQADLSALQQFKELEKFKRTEALLT